jgi:hypothetical protein
LPAKECGPETAVVVDADVALAKQMSLSRLEHDLMECGLRALRSSRQDEAPNRQWRYRYLNMKTRERVFTS